MVHLLLPITQSYNMKKPINTEPDGSCRTIKAQYYKNGVANFIRGALRSNRSDRVL